MTTTAKVAQPTEKAATLDARAYATKQRLESLYGELNSSWESVEKELRGLVPPRHVFVSYRSWKDDEDQPRYMIHMCLGLVKYRGEWRVCHGCYHDDRESEPETWKPIIECSVEERVETVDHIEKLKNKIVEAAEKSEPEVKAALAKMSRLLFSML